MGTPLVRAEQLGVGVEPLLCSATVLPLDSGSEAEKRERGSQVERANP